MFFKPEDLYAAGQTGSDLVKGLASEVANQVCGLYENYPRSFGISNPAGNAVNALTSGVMDSFCGRLPEPKIPSPPGDGTQEESGQCCSAEYDFVVTFNAGNFSGGACQGLTFTGLTTTFRGLGEIVDVRGSADGRVIEYVRRDCQGNLQVSEVTQRDEFCRQPTGYSFTLAPGFENACGGAQEGYPSDLAPSSNPGTYPHTGNDGVARPINFNIDFPSGGGFPSISFPDFPDLNIPVKIDATGIDIDIPIGIGNNTDKNGGLTDDNLEDLLVGAKAATRGARAGNRAADGGSDNEGGTGEDGIEGLYGVYFDAVTIPTWFGKVFGSPLKYRLGRISFKRDGYHLRDEDILFAKQYFVAPADANGYVATYEPEVVGKITVIREIQE